MSETPNPMVTPSQEFYRGQPRKAEKVAKGLDRIYETARGQTQRSRGKQARLSAAAKRVQHRYENTVSHLSEGDFIKQLRDIRVSFRSSDISRQTVEEGLSLVLRAAKESLDLIPYHVQIVGALSIDNGRFAEMATGEGKTLTIALAATLAGWRGRPCHVITANDYLAERDAEEMQPLFSRCGVSVASVTGDLQGERRGAAYQSDVVYTTSQQLLADHLRDRLALQGKAKPIQQLVHQLAAVDDGTPASAETTSRGIHRVIVDEADNVLIDEAVTPLIISRSLPRDVFSRSCRIARRLALELREGHHYKVIQKYQEVEITRAGRQRILEQAHALPPIWQTPARREEIVRVALVAEHLFLRDKNYAVVEESVEIIDEFTGRIQEGRTWQQGLQQAIETKEKLPISDPTETLASMSFQRFFRSFHHMSGVSGTAIEGADELWRVYHLPVFQVPTHLPIKRTINAPILAATQESRLTLVMKEIEQVHGSDRPILIGTRSVRTSVEVGAALKEAGLAHEILNAVEHQKEAEIVARAGAKGAITVATNMAGRGTDIKIDAAVEALGGLHVIVFEPNLSSRIDRQLLGRAGRQGQAGSGRIFACPSDELFRRYLPRRLQSLLVRACQVMPVAARKTIAARYLRIAQRRAERLNAKQREAVLRMDQWTEENLAFTREEAR